MYLDCSGAVCNSAEVYNSVFWGSNDSAIALYERFGFRREGYRVAHYRRGREYLDAILMAYAISD